MLPTQPSPSPSLSRPTSRSTLTYLSSSTPTSHHQSPYHSHLNSYHPISTHRPSPNSSSTHTTTSTTTTTTTTSCSNSSFRLSLSALATAPYSPPPIVSDRQVPLILLPPSLPPSASPPARPPRTSSLNNPVADLQRRSSAETSMVAFSSLSPEDQATAQHVRKVYAYLEQVGVPGDGFADGVERTREHRRLSANLLQQQQQKKASLSEPELAVLRCADRYGFFKSPTSERLTPLHPRAFFPSTVSPAPGEAPGPSTPPSHDLEARRISKWTEMLVGDKRDAGSNILSYRLSPQWESQPDRFGKRCYKGIPDRWRRAGWDLLIEDYGRRITQSSSQSVERLLDLFEQTVNVPSDQDVQIDLDVPRTINGHVFFHTRYGRGLVLNFLIFLFERDVSDRRIVIGGSADGFCLQSTRSVSGTPLLRNVLRDLWILSRDGTDRSDAIELL